MYSSTNFESFVRHYFEYLETVKGKYRALAQEGLQDYGKGIVSLHVTRYSTKIEDVSLYVNYMTLDALKEAGPETDHLVKLVEACSPERGEFVISVYSAEGGKDGTHKVASKIFC